jgi:hypothetical protein
MKEKIEVGGKQAWILIEPHKFVDQEDGQQVEYFTASYTFDVLSSGPGVVLFLDKNSLAKRFQSPVQALEYANEKLLGGVRSV